MKGYVYTFEVLLAAIMMITFLLVISFQQQDVSNVPADLDETAYDLLRSLDSRGLLRQYAAAGDYQSLNSEIVLYRYNHSIEICDYENNCAGSAPDASDVWTGTYVISGGDTYSPHIVRLYLW